MNTIVFDHVNKSFGGVHAIHDLNLSFKEGEIHALLGHNGAGKTTTLRLMLGLLKPDSGNITVFSQDPLIKRNTVRNLCGVLSEDVGLYESLSVYDNLIYYSDLYGIPRKEANHRMDELLEQFHLLDKKKLVVKGFSTGMKMKVALIRAMLHKPRILLLDEPTNGLDPVSTMDLRAMLIKLAKEEKTTIIMTTHNLEEVQKLCDKITIMRQGVNIFTASMSSLKDSKEYLEDGQFSLEKLYMDLETRR